MYPPQMAQMPPYRPQSLVYPGRDRRAAGSDRDFDILDDEEETRRQRHAQYAKDVAIERSRQRRKVHQQVSNSPLERVVVISFNPLWLSFQVSVGSEGHMSEPQTPSDDRGYQPEGNADDYDESESDRPHSRESFSKSKVL